MREDSFFYQLRMREGVLAGISFLLFIFLISFVLGCYGAHGKDETALGSSLFGILNHFPVVLFTILIVYGRQGLFQQRFYIGGLIFAATSEIISTVRFGGMTEPSIWITLVMFIVLSLLFTAFQGIGYWLVRTRRFSLKN